MIAPQEGLYQTLVDEYVGNKSMILSRFDRSSVSRNLAYSLKSPSTVCKIDADFLFIFGHSATLKIIRLFTK